ncbi:MAG TPA: hypothetical protein PKY54_02595 [Chitinophagales bacterium]|nr:hypothetical protein [Chitinophagales bacterium]
MNNYELLVEKLDAFIRKFYLNKLLRGALLFAGILLGFYLFISLFEYQLYLSSTIRKSLLFGFIGITIFAFGTLILKPLIHYLKLGQQISHEQAASIIGNHFADVKDKLLNILQLKHQSQNAYNKELIEASIQQKLETIKLVPFSNAVNLNENKKYLKYVVPPLFILLFLLVAAPNILTESNTRLLNPNTRFAKKAPFVFVLQNKKMKMLQYDDIEIHVQIKGKTVPNEVYINEDGKNYKMEKKAADLFSYRFTNLQKDMQFYFSAGEFNSDEHHIRVLKKPVIANFTTQLHYPSYINKKDETIKNTGDLLVPVGSSVHWDFETSGTDNVKIAFDGQLYHAVKNNNNQFTFSKKITRDTRYTVYVANHEIENGDSVSFTIAATPDNFPSISVEKIQDSTQKDFAIFLGAVADDYGISRLEFHYTIKDENGKLIISKKQQLPLANKSISDFNFQIDFAKYQLNNGEKMDYYFEVFDNDAVTGPKSTKSQLFVYDKPTINELEKQEYQNSEDIKDNLSAATKSAAKLAAQIKEMKEKILSKKSLSWEDKKQLEEIQKKHQELTKELEAIKDKYDENLKNQDEFKKPDEDILQKQEKLQEMLKDMLSDEMKDLMKQIEDILQKMEQKNTFENLDKMELSNKDLKSELDKMEKLFKQLQLEQKAQETIDKLNALAKEQEQLAQQTKDKKEAQSDLQKKQESLNKKMDNIKEDLKQLEQFNKENDNKLDTKDNEGDAEDIKENMENSSDELQQEQNDKAAKSQKSAAQKMQKMAQKMKSGLDKMQQDQAAEDIKMIRQLLENLVKLSFEQEQLMNELKKTETESPKYTQIMQKQYDLRDDAKLIGDSLQALGKRQFQLQSFISDEMYKLNREIKKAIDNMEERNKIVASVAQQMAMTATNNLALMLSESLDNMQMQMNQSKPGSGACKKPGGKGEKPSMSEMQKKLGEQLGKMQEGMKQGQDPKKMGKDFADAVQQQAAIREALRQMKEQMSQNQKKGENGIGGVDEMIKKMDELERELATKKLSSESLKRHKEIETRLLELEKAQRNQEEDEKRQSKSAIEIPRKLPPNLEDYLQKRKSALELYQTVPPNLKPFYKNLVEKYLRLVN